ncbi:hypothetical protein [Streptomyces sp. AN091965]|uniref:hypothetical protein n=1 Tax=Streptomyces sp. AN091965 TaxID=2927803 RepID=UPI001F615D5A|nr:hypothetical protein [Streptomyces sp. AN091965]MCI3928839.1 hypothetical protein [Streptomyces sp. AN091965]
MLITLDTHPARDDEALRHVLEDASMGRWEGPRDMLVATGPDWDRRIFRLQVLAEAGARLRFADTWAEAEPHSPHALALLGNVQALRAMIAGRVGGESLMEEAWATCCTALDVWPQDVAPLVVMLALLRTHAPDRRTLNHVWTEIKQRDPWNREAHHEFVTYLFVRHHGTPGEAMWWAEEQASIAPKGLPIAILPLVVLAEVHRCRQEQNQDSYGLMIHPWVDCPQINLALERWWRYRAPRPHACFADDANYLAHALSFANRHHEASEVFDAIGPYATRVPWAYCGRARELFLRHRAWAYSPPRRRRR